MTKKILFVDDDQKLLKSYQRYLGLEYKIDTALGGELGLEMLGKRGPYAVVVSDMRMPGMDGTRFLSQVREHWPDTVRMLLTGQADMKDAVAVVNEGQIFRFLTKPCPPEKFAQALNDGLEQYRLLTVDKELLIQKERLRVLKATMMTVHDIVNNNLNRLLLFRLKAEEKNVLDVESLEHFDAIIHDTAEKLKILASLERIPEAELTAGMLTLTPKHG